MQTTLKKIRAHSPCASGWTRLLTFLGKTKADNEPLPLTSILESNGLNDTLWCLQDVDGFEREKRLFAVWCARRVQYLMTDPRSLAALDVVEQFANGQASLEELADAAAWAANAANAADAAWACTDARDAKAAANAAAWAADAAWACTDARDAKAAANAAADAAWACTDANAARVSQTQELKRVLACTEAGIDPYPPSEGLIMNDFNLLRPVVFADLKVGEVLQAYSGLLPTVAYKAPAFAVLKFEDGSERCYEIYKLETSYKLVPLCWVENKPVYPGDGPLYYKDNPAWRHNEEGMFAWSVRDDELHFYNRMAFPIYTATWTKPEQKREPSFQVEGKDVFPGEVVYYYGVNSTRWGFAVTVEANGCILSEFGQTTPAGDYEQGAATFRLKPMLVIGDQLVPMPVRNAAEMKKGDAYYTPCLDSDTGHLSYAWSNHSFDIEMCDKGLVHLNSEAASAHTEAFIALSKKKD